MRHLHVGGRGDPERDGLDDPFALGSYTRCMMPSCCSMPAAARADGRPGGGSLAKFFHRRLADCAARGGKRRGADRHARASVPFRRGRCAPCASERRRAMAGRPCFDLLVGDGFEGESTPSPWCRRRFLRRTAVRAGGPGPGDDFMDDDGISTATCSASSYALFRAAGARVSFAALPAQSSVHR